MLFFPRENTSYWAIHHKRLRQRKPLWHVWDTSAGGIGARPQEGRISFSSCIDKLVTVCAASRPQGCHIHALGAFIDAVYGIQPDKSVFSAFLAASV